MIVGAEPSTKEPTFERRSIVTQDNATRLAQAPISSLLTGLAAVCRNPPKLGEEFQTFGNGRMPKFLVSY